MSKKILVNIPFEKTNLKTDFKNNIWFFGDSITKGAGCLDPSLGNEVWECDFFVKYPEYRSETWTTTLANYFKRNKRNYGASGASPELVLNIFTNFLNEFKQGDIIIIQIPFITRGFYFQKIKNKTEYQHYSGYEDLDKNNLSLELFNTLEKYILYFQQDYYRDWVNYYTELFYDFVKYFKEKEIEIYIWNGDAYNNFENIADFTHGKINDHHLSWNGHSQIAKQFIKKIESGNYYNKNNSLLHKWTYKHKSLIG